MNPADRRPGIFWMVWRAGTTEIQARHYTSTDAVREAERLAKLHPGEEFYVLKAQYLSIANSVRTYECE